MLFCVKFVSAANKKALDFTCKKRDMTKDLQTPEKEQQEVYKKITSPIHRRLMLCISDT
jgi:hypothetical protein